MKTTLQKALDELILNAAYTLLKANNTVTNLEIKNYLIKNEPQVMWKQDMISKSMIEFAGDGIFSWTDNGTYRTYSNIAKKTKITQPSVKQKFATVMTSKGLQTYSSNIINRKDALKLILSSSGRFFTVVFNKKGTKTDRRMNCQLMKVTNSTSSTLIKVKENIKNKLTPNDSIRQFDLNTLKELKIFGKNYQVK